MKTATAIIAGLAFGILGISPAFAWHLVPESTDFTGAGNTSATKSGITLKCSASLTGDTDSSGVGYITGGSFTGQIGCTSVALENLPWTSTAVSAKDVDIDNVTFSSPIGDCGPSTLVVKLSKAGVFTWKNAALAGGCKISGTITTSPKITIAKDE